MQKQNYLGVDLGAESGRVMVAAFDGRQVSLTQAHRFATGGIRIADTMRWDLLHFWKEIQHGLRAAAASAGGEDTVSVGVDTWGVDYVLLGKNDEMLGLPWHYRDSRNVGMLGEVTKRVSRADVFRQTGIQFIEINSLYQLTADRLAGGLLDQAKKFLMVPDFFHWCLSGTAVGEFTNATTSQCFDPTTRDWARPLLQQLDIPTDIFPDVVQPGDSLGAVRDSVCRETGLPGMQVIAPSTHDTGSAIAAVPVSPEHLNNWAYISSGTWSLVGVETQAPILTEEALALNVTNEGGVDGTWRVLKNVMGLWLVQGLKGSFERAGKSLSYDEITRKASQSAGLQSLIDPDHASFLNPPDMLTAVSDFCRQTNQSVPGDEGAAVRCVLESLALRYRVVLNSISKLSGQAINVIHVVGGGSRNALLNQFIADACSVPVVAGPVEATVLGNVLVQCRAAGELGSLADIREVVRQSSELKIFEPTAGSNWDSASERFRSLCVPSKS